MTEKRFIIIQNGNNFTVKDTVEKNPWECLNLKKMNF